jgi:hypothetical protein
VKVIGVSVLVAAFVNIGVVDLVLLGGHGYQSVDAGPPALVGSAAADVVNLPDVLSPKSASPREVPLARILASPRSYDGKSVYVVGYVGVVGGSHGGLFLYLTSDDQAIRATVNAIRLELDSFDPREIQGASEVVGTFRSSEDWSDVSGEIHVEQIRRFRLVSQGDGGARLDVTTSVYKPELDAAP